MRRRLAVAFAVALALAAPARAGERYFTGIGDLEGATFSSMARAVSDAGLVVGFGTDWDTEYPWGFRSRAITWTAEGGLVALDPAFDSAIEVSADGTTMVFLERPGNVWWWWTAATGPVPIGDGTWVHALSADGSTVVGVRPADLPNSSTEAFRWTLAGGLEGLGFLPNGYLQSEAVGVSRDGRIITGSSSNDTLAPGFLWTEETGMQPLPPMLGKGQPRFTYTISANGSTVAGHVRGEIFMWSAAGGYTYLPWVAPLGRSPRQLDANGFVMVGGNDNVFVENENTAFYWSASTGMRPLAEILKNVHLLSTDGWILHDALGMSPNGRYIVGFGTNPQGQREGWVAYLGAPATCGLGFEIVLVVPLLVLRRRRKRRA